MVPIATPKSVELRSQDERVSIQGTSAYALIVAHHADEVRLFVHDSHFQAINEALRWSPTCSLIGSGSIDRKSREPTDTLTVKLSELSVFVCPPLKLKELLTRALPACNVEVRAQDDMP